MTNVLCSSEEESTKFTTFGNEEITIAPVGILTVPTVYIVQQTTDYYDEVIKGVFLNEQTAKECATSAKKALVSEGRWTEEDCEIKVRGFEVSKSWDEDE